jgi:hypothetical protein
MNDYISHLMYLVDTLQLQLPLLLAVSVLTAGLFLLVLIRMFEWTHKDGEMQGGPDDLPSDQVVDGDTTSIADRNDNVIFHCRNRFAQYKSYPTRRREGR